MDKVRNEDIRKKTGSRKLADIIKERRLRWLRHILRINNSRTARQATQWEEAEILTYDKAEWRRRVAQCSHLDAG